MKIRLHSSAIWFTLAASFIYMVNAGIRNNFGIMLTAITENTGLSLASVSFVLAVGQLCFGVTQPFSGLAAERYGNRRTLLAGAFGIIAGAALLPFCEENPGDKRAGRRKTVHPADFVPGRPEKIHPRPRA